MTHCEMRDKLLMLQTKKELQIWSQGLGFAIGQRTWGQKKGSVTHDWPKTKIRKKYDHLEKQSLKH